MTYDEYYDPDESWHHGDQSWQFYRAAEMGEFYESEFQPEPTNRKKTKGFSIRGKIESLRRSFFNQGSSLEQTPEPVRRTSKGGIKGKIDSWRRSWFGPEPSPRIHRKLSLSQTLFGSKEAAVQREKKPGLMLLRTITLFSTFAAIDSLFYMPRLVLC